MTAHRYTIVCEYRGGTYVSQVVGDDVCEAVRLWTDYLLREEPIPRCSTLLARSVASSLDDDPPVSLDGLSGVWSISGTYGGNFMLANVVESALPLDGS